MCKDKNEQSQNQSEPKTGQGDVIKGQVNENLYNKKPLNEGYQPVRDTIDPSTPPTDSGVPDKKSDE
ncbi:MAG: hypothetical protein WC223_10565 [Bacteroidales bacterium]|jgi:hypothetical protein